MTIHISSTNTGRPLAITFTPNVRPTTSISAYLPIGVFAVLSTNMLGILLFALHLRRRRRQSKHTCIESHPPEDQGGVRYRRSEDLDNSRQIDAIPEIPNVHPDFIGLSEEVQLLCQKLDGLKAQVEEMRLQGYHIPHEHEHYLNTTRNDDILNTCPLLDLDTTPPPAYTADLT